MSGQELGAKDKALAEALGYAVVRIPDARGSWRYRQDGYQLCDADGDAVWGYDPQAEEETDLFDTEEEAWGASPDFYASVDACLDVLPETVHVRIQVVEWHGDTAKVYRGWILVADRREDWSGIGATRAEALANAVLAWAKARTP